MKALLAIALVLAPTVTQAAPLTVRTGETWVFSIARGQPVKARKVEATTAAPRGQVKVSVRAAFGTMMTISTNGAQGYTFDAQLVDATGKAVNARSCTLPPNNQPALENWPQKATAVRIGNFRPAKGGRC
jgi:hypothetical protein